MTHYLIDFWSLGHAGLWGVLGVFGASLRYRWWLIGLLALYMGLVWELFEWRLLEPVLQFREPFWNRWGTDLIADTAGALIGAWAARRYWLASDRLGYRKSSH